ncbi:GNAT family N-acetyltransferase [Flavobacterium beibuense]|uniref:Aminoalkylphosphonic acid N-acetyltransferase n=1 Tax=Flavobacterium beibuense TaxID=657326 RepID=A0A444W9K1_9FLAO|nr:GNAT family N-acetyltransferase [Flavobacterium beibuense]RYJ42524.1 Aminoalkylphosphonic acid N-acetyltransferase [Flavobacterium beibuense]
MTTRFATQEDVRVVYGFINELENTVFDYDTFEKYYFENLENKNNIYLVATDTVKNVIGFCSSHGQILLHHQCMVFEIQELFIATDYRDRKVGRFLLQALEDILKQQGHELLEVTSNKRRTEAHRFYINNGFAESHFKFTKKLG